MRLSSPFRYFSALFCVAASKAALGGASPRIVLAEAFGYQCPLSSMWGEEMLWGKGASKMRLRNQDIVLHKTIFAQKKKESKDLAILNLLPDFFFELILPDL